MSRFANGNPSQPHPNMEHVLIKIIRGSYGLASQIRARKVQVQRAKCKQINPINAPLPQFGTLQIYGNLFRYLSIT